METEPNGEPEEEVDFHGTPTSTPENPPQPPQEDEDAEPEDSE